MLGEVSTGDLATIRTPAVGAVVRTVVCPLTQICLPKDDHASSSQLSSDGRVTWDLGTEEGVRSS